MKGEKIYRKCHVHFGHSNLEENKDKELRIEGYFHQFGNKIIHIESSETGPRTEAVILVAFIEDQKGEIHSIEPELIKFDIN